MGKRVMAFVDGTNFLNALGRCPIPRKQGSPFVGRNKLDPHQPPPSAVSICNKAILRCISQMPRFKGGDGELIRINWFGSASGDEHSRDRYCEVVKKQKYFHPTILRKNKGGDEKGVDMHLAIEALVHAANSNFDVAILVAGDEDYVRLVSEVKRHGPMVVGTFFAADTAPALKRECDLFFELGAALGKTAWQGELDALIKALMALPDLRDKDLEKKARKVVSLAGTVPSDPQATAEMERTVADLCGGPVTVSIKPRG